MDQPVAAVEMEFVADRQDSGGVFNWRRLQ
jgi:hypothetical protein